MQEVTVTIPNPRPIVTYSIIAVTVAVFGLQMLSQNLAGQDLVAALGDKYNPAILAGEYWRFITPVLLHGGFIHIAFNMYALFAIGPQLEKTYGHFRYLALYLLGGFAGNVLSFIFTPGASLGASTAIFGLLAAEGIFIYQNRKFFGGRSRAILINIIGIAAINLIIGRTLPGIDNWGHLGGLVGGLLFAWFGGPVWDVRGIPPNLMVADRREPIQVELATAGVAILFSAIAAYSILIH